jgi:hypothetical protein
MFENSVLRRMFEPKRDDLKGGWRRTRNEDLYNLYSLPDIMMIKSNRMRWAEHVARMGEMKNTYKLFVEKPKRKRSLGRPRRRCEYNTSNISKKYMVRGCGLGSLLLIVAV